MIIFIFILCGIFLFSALYFLNEVDDFLVEEKEYKLKTKLNLGISSVVLSYSCVLFLVIYQVESTKSNVKTEYKPKITTTTIDGISTSDTTWIKQ